MPLLATSLERAIQLAETMEARGFATVLNPASSESSQRRAILTQAGLLAALLGLLAGLFLLTVRDRREHLGLGAAHAERSRDGR